MYPPLSGLFDSRPVTCVSFRQPRPRDEKAILEAISSECRLFSHFFRLAWRKATSRFSFSVRCFARETSEIHRLLRMKFDLELRGNYFLSFLFRNDFPTGFKTVLFPFENKRNLRKGSICLIDIRFCEISQKYRIQISNRGNLSKSSFLRNR